MGSGLPIYTRAIDGAKVEAWLVSHDLGGRLPLMRVAGELEPIVLPDAPTTGAEAAVAREVIDRLEDVRIAAAALCGAAAAAGLAIGNEPSLFGYLIRPRPWTAPAIAARAPLSRIVAACNAFEDAFYRISGQAADVALTAVPSPTGRGKDGAAANAAFEDEEDARLRALAGALDPRAVEALPNDMRDLPPDVARRPTFAVPIASEDKIVDRRVTSGGVGETIAAVAKASAAVAAAAPALETMDAVSRTIAAAERFGASAFVSSSPLSPAEAAQLFRDPPPRMSLRDEATLAAASRDFARFSQG